MRSLAVRCLLVIALCLAALSLAAQAASGPRYALVIGNGAYAELAKLKNPANDAKDVAAALQELGFEVKLLVDADLGSMEDAAIRLGNSLAQSADSMGFFFYAGHGVQSGGVNYLIPADARIPGETFLKTKALPAQSVLDILQASRNALNIVVLDACRDNPFSWGRGGSRGLSVVGAQPPGSIVAYATSSGSIAQDGQGRNGVFTAELLKQLKTPGLEIKEIFNRTGKAVQTATAGKQVPAVYNQFFDSAYLAGLKAAAPASPAVPAPPAGPTMSITRAYGSLRVSAATAGSLYLDGTKLGDLPAGARAELANIEVGERRLELRYAEDSPETLAVTVVEGQATSVSFSWKKPAAPAGFVLVPAGSFLMGSPAGEAGRDNNEGPQHEVRLSAFYISKYEVTFDEYDEYCDATGKAKPGDSGWGRGRRPVFYVNWNDCVEYCNWRSKREGLRPCYTISGATVSCDWTANGYRLPTEAEWEYAAKGGPAARGLAVYAVYAGSASPDQVAWYNDNSGGKTHLVGEKAANALGLYDMAGNVWEWCWDWCGSYTAGAQVDPSAAGGGLWAIGADQFRGVRGGGWSTAVADARSAFRYAQKPNIGDPLTGFRVLRRPTAEEAQHVSVPAIQEEIKAVVQASAPAAPSPAPSGFVLVPAGSFLMGSPAGEAGRQDDEGPQHEVRLSAFYISKYEVTVEEYRAYVQATGYRTHAEWLGCGFALTGSGWEERADVNWRNPYFAQGERNPVVFVSWDDCVEYCNWRSKREGLRPCYTISGDTVSCDWSANGYRLPTEAEWEYAAKGGPAARGLAVNAVYAGSASPDQVAWYDDNSGGKTHPVGEKTGNALGIYDMAGNVWEWCWDWYGSYSGGAQVDPRGCASGDDRVLRGGCWNDYGGARNLRSAGRGRIGPGDVIFGFGFRLVVPQIGR